MRTTSGWLQEREVLVDVDRSHVEAARVLSSKCRTLSRPGSQARKAMHARCNGIQHMFLTELAIGKGSRLV